MMYGLIIIISGKKGIMRLLVDPSHGLHSRLVVVLGDRKAHGERQRSSGKRTGQ